jgi:hypothetical protein
MDMAKTVSHYDFCFEILYQDWFLRTSEVNNYSRFASLCEKYFESFYATGWCVGTVERTEEKGDFPAEAVYVLPCLTKPPADILVQLQTLVIYLAREY